jgi:SOS-response transcriptional repressor LexA
MSTLQERMGECFPAPRPRGLNTEIANLCGVKGSSVTNWFNNPEKVSTISRSNAEKLCAFYGLDVSPAWLAEGIPPKHMASNVSPGPDPKGRYPLISEVQAGMWTELYDQFQPGDAGDWLPSTKNLGPHGYMLRVSGKSMEDPGGRFSFPEGMVLHVNPDITPVPSQFVIVRRESTQEAVFKRYVMIDGEPYLEAINPDWPKDMKFLKLQPGDAWCGVVVDASLNNLP